MSFNLQTIKYVLISPARNEELLIRKLLDSVSSQTVLPERFIVVDDGSTDRTADIVQEYERRFPWIELVSHPNVAKRSFAGKVQAFNAGLARVQHLDYEVIGNLDADVSFDEDYLAFLMRKFDQDQTLGVAGT